MKNTSFISFSRIGNKYFCTEINRPKSYRADGENDFGRKIGQLNQYNDDITATYPIEGNMMQNNRLVVRAKLGFILNAIGGKTLGPARLQAMQSVSLKSLLLGKMLVPWF